MCSVRRSPRLGRVDNRHDVPRRYAVDGAVTEAGNVFEPDFVSCIEACPLVRLCWVRPNQVHSNEIFGDPTKRILSALRFRLPGAFFLISRVDPAPDQFLPLTRLLASLLKVDDVVL